MMISLRSRVTIMIICAVCVAAFADNLQAAYELLFSDTYDIGSNTDINADLASRQAGTAATSTYTDLDSSLGYGALPEIYNNALWLTAPYVSGVPEPWLKAKATVGLDANLNASSGHPFTVDAFLSLDNVGGDNWAAVTIDETKDGDLPGVSDISFVVRPDTTYDLWVNGTKIIDENDNAHGLFSGLEHNVQFSFDESVVGGGTFDLLVDGATVISDQAYWLPADRYLMLQSFALGAEGGVDVTHVFDNIEIQMDPTIGPPGPVDPPDPVQIAHWSFDSDLSDSVGGHDGTAVGGAAITNTPDQARVGAGALTLDKDQQQFVTIDSLADELSTGNSVSMTMWFNTTRDGAGMVHNGDNVFFSAHTVDGSVNLMRTGTGVNGGIYLNPTDIGGPEPDEENGSGMNDGEWHFLAMTLETDGTTTVYVDVDGTLEEIEGFTDRPGQPKWSMAGLVSFGQEWDGATPSNFYDGLIDDVQIWKGLMTLEDLQAVLDAAGEVTQPIPGDANEDGAVDVSDLGILATNYGITSGMLWANADFTGDGAVDVSDLGILATNYGMGTATSSSVPEPSILMMLLGFVALTALVRRR